MPISGNGWELHVERLGLHTKGGKVRTYGVYQVYIDGIPVEDLTGAMCETIGPGDNSEENNGLRVEAKTYPLALQNGSRYKTVGYTDDLTPPGKKPMPGLLLNNTGARTAILIHPGHPPTLYLSSVGCFNPTRSIGPSEFMDFEDSRDRVIALIDSLRAYAPGAFTNGHSKPIPGASVVVDGEPMNQLGQVHSASALAPTLELLGAAGPSIAKVSLAYKPGGSLATVDVLFHQPTALATAPATASALSSDELALGQKVPNKSEVSACGDITKKIKRADPEFAALVKNQNPKITFKDEEGTGADRMMTPRLNEKMNALADLVASEWSDAKLRVTEAWDENNEHHGMSLHYEGRAADLTTDPKDGDRLGRLARLAVDAGFDWVFFEDTAHVHVSVKK